MTARTNRRTFLALACSAAAACRRSPRAFPSQQQLVEWIATSTPDTVLGRIAPAIESGATPDDLLAASCIALLDTGADAGDVHALLVLPSIRQVIGDARGIERWMPVLWAVTNASLWSRGGRVNATSSGAPPAPEEDPSSRDTFSSALDRGDAIQAQRVFRGWMRRLGREGAVAELLLEASRPREDPHGAIFAAQAVRLLPLVGPRGDDLLLSVVRYLARPSAGSVSSLDAGPLAAAAASSNGDAVARLAVIERATRAAMEARITDESVSGPGVHHTTLLDALLFASEGVSLRERDEVLRRMSHWISAIPGRGSASSRTRHAAASARLVAEQEASFMRSHRQRLVEHAGGEHDFKHFAAVESVADVLDGERRRQWVATLALGYTAEASSRWERWDEAKRIAERAPGV